MSHRRPRNKYSKIVSRSSSDRIRCFSFFFASNFDCSCNWCDRGFFLGSYRFSVGVDNDIYFYKMLRNPIYRRVLHREWEWIMARAKGWFIERTGICDIEFNHSLPITFKIEPLRLTFFNVLLDLIGLWICRMVSCRFVASRNESFSFRKSKIVWCRMNAWILYALICEMVQPKSIRRDVYVYICWYTTHMCLNMNKRLQSRCQMSNK